MQQGIEVDVVGVENAQVTAASRRSTKGSREFRLSAVRVFC